VLALGTVLMTLGKDQIRMSEDLGETAAEIAACMQIMLQALPQSSLSPAQKILWAIKTDLDDDFDLCDDIEQFMEGDFGIEDWMVVAKELEQSLDVDQVPTEEPDFRHSYRRNRLTDWLVIAWEESSQHEKIIPLLEDEAIRTGSYPRLVAYLKNAGHRSEAEEWIKKGIDATETDRPGIADALREEWIAMLEEQGDWHSVASLRAESFFRRPTTDTYQQLQIASEYAGVWIMVRSGALRYLEAGSLPWVGLENEVEENTLQWPLTKCEGSVLAGNRRLTFPMFEVLIDIALLERRLEDVVHWYRQRNLQRDGWDRGSPQDDKIAEAVVQTHPDVAIEIWRQTAEKQIAKTQTKAYEVAARYLRKIYHALEKLVRDEEWQLYLLGINKANHRKIRLLEILDGLVGRPIVDG